MFLNTIVLRVCSKNNGVLNLYPNPGRTNTGKWGNFRWWLVGLVETNQLVENTKCSCSGISPSKSGMLNMKAVSLKKEVCSLFFHQ